jgi:hypothetical protein
MANNNVMFGLHVNRLFIFRGMQINWVPSVIGLIRSLLFHVILFASNAQTKCNVHHAQFQRTVTHTTIMFQSCGLSDKMLLNENLLTNEPSSLSPRTRTKACMMCQAHVPRFGMLIGSSFRKPKLLQALSRARRSNLSPGMKIINGASGDSGGVDGVHINGGPRRDTFDPALYEAAMLRERWADDSAQRAKSEPKTSEEVGVSVR